MPDLEIFSDFNCIWCYFDCGSVESIQDEYDVNLVRRAFPLHPDIPSGGIPIVEYFGNNSSLMDEKMRILEEKARELDLPLARRTMISGSRPAQELSKWAKTKGQEDTFHKKMYAAYFADGLNISDMNVLLAVVESVGLCRNEAMAVLESRRFKASVDEDWERSETLEIMAAPSYVMGDVKLMGPQTFETLQHLLESHGIEKRQGA